MTEFYLGDKAAPFIYVRAEEWAIVAFIIGYFILRYLKGFIGAWLKYFRSTESGIPEMENPPPPPNRPGSPMVLGGKSQLWQREYKPEKKPRYEYTVKIEHPFIQNCKAR